MRGIIFIGILIALYSLGLLPYIFGILVVLVFLAMMFIPPCWPILLILIIIAVILD